MAKQPKQYVKHIPGRQVLFPGTKEVTSSPWRYRLMMAMKGIPSDIAIASGRIKPKKVRDGDAERVRGDATS